MPRRLWHYKDAPRPEQRCACRQLVAGRSVAVCAIAGCPQPQPLMGEIDAGRLAANSAMTRARAYVESQALRSQVSELRLGRLVPCPPPLVHLQMAAELRLHVQDEALSQL